MADEWLTLKEAATMAGCSEGTVRNWVVSRQLRPVRDIRTLNRHHYRIHRAVLEHFLAAREAESVQSA